jgi:hypothetical protein
MRIKFRSVLLATATLCATAAFAADTATVNIPFSFVSQGQTFPAGKYVATLDRNNNLIDLSSVDASVSAHWMTGPAEYNPDNEKLTMKFADAGNSHYLSSVQLGPRVASRLDTPSRHHNAGSNAAAVSGQ